MILFAYSVLFPTNTKLPFCKKSKDDLLPEPTLKDDLYRMI